MKCSKCGHKINEPFIMDEDPKWSKEDFILNVMGNTARCDCGSNVYKKALNTEQKIYKCNGCGHRT